MRRRCKGNEQDGQSGPPRSAKLLQSMLAECGDSSRLLELYYFSREPEVLEIMRAIAALPEDARASLEAFLAVSHDPAAITAKWDGAGRLTLASPQVGQTMAMISFCAENDDLDKPLLPN